MPPMSRHCKSSALITSLLVLFLPPVLRQNLETLVLSAGVLKAYCGTATPLDLSLVTLIDKHRADIL